MEVKSISSTAIHTGFGNILDDVLSGKLIIIERHRVPKAAIVSFRDLESLLGDEKRCREIRSRIQKLLMEPGEGDNTHPGKR